MSTETPITDVEASLDNFKGAFVTSLQRNNKQIKSDRALAIAEDAEMKYKRKVEDLRLEIKKLKRERANLLDLSPADKTTLILASDFKSDQFVATDIDLGLKIRQLEITLEIAEKQYNYLFNEE